MKVSFKFHAQAALPPVERATGTHWIDAVEGVEKMLPCWESNPGVTIPTKLQLCCSEHKSRLAVALRMLIP